MFLKFLKENSVKTVVTRAVLVVVTAWLFIVLLSDFYQNQKNPNWNKYPGYVDIGSKEDFYRLEIPEEFGVRAQADERNLEWNVIGNVLYPEMKKWTVENRKSKGPERDMIDIAVRYYPDNKNRNSQDYVLKQIENEGYYKLGIPNDEASKKLLKKYPNIKTYFNKRGEIYSYVFYKNDGQLVRVRIGNKNFYHNIRTSWHGKFELEYYISDGLFYDMVDIANKVDDLITSFNPTHHNLTNQNSEQTKPKP